MSNKLINFISFSLTCAGFIGLMFWMIEIAISHPMYTGN